MRQNSSHRLPEGGILPSGRSPRLHGLVSFPPTELLSIAGEGKGIWSLCFFNRIGKVRGDSDKWVVGGELFYETTSGDW